MEWIQAHWTDVLAVVGAVDTALLVITRLTPTKWDDNVFAFIHSWILRLLPPKV